MTWYRSKKLRLPVGPTFSSSPGWTSLALNDSTRKVGGIFQMPPGVASHTITRAACRVGPITGTSPTYRISIQGVTTGGIPDGTIKGGGTPASATFQPTTANQALLLSLDNSYSAIPGELLAVVVDYSAGTVDGSNHAQLSYTVTSALDCALNPYGVDFQASWTKRTEAAPFGIGTSSDLWGEGLFDAIGSTGVFANSSTPNEYGICFQVPSYYSHIRVDGFQFMPVSFAVGGEHTATIYSGGGVSDTTALESVVFDSDTIQGNRRNVVLFDSATPIELAGGQSYRIAIRPNSTQTANINFVSVSDEDLWDTTPLEQSSHYTTRAGGSWTDTLTRKMPWALLVSEVELAAGGGTAGFTGIRGVSRRLGT